ncbi:hypothetical protein CryarDRAFT_1689 [Cryptosporangium arvum DSM 44712]|uniref:Peptidase inhibitor family I36 n=2 Tax=Cryptosporangium TaxID=65502 RepID=A0A010YK39_9ACTN|nr:hypothetical protein CryarDRAFT_1689 [Cryptosporangium arvum DSM 44712]
MRAMNPLWSGARRSKRTAVAAFVTALIAVVGNMFTASPAAAAYADCYNYLGTICLADNTDVTGQIWRQYPNQIGSCRNFSAEGFNDKASFAWFNIQRPSSAPRPHVVLWRHAGCSGTSGNLGMTLDPGQQWHGERQTNGEFNNQISSISISYY